MLDEELRNSAVEPQAEPGESAPPTDATGSEEPGEAAEAAESATAEDAWETPEEEGAEPSRQDESKGSGAQARIKQLVAREKQLAVERDQWREEAIKAGFKPPEAAETSQPEAFHPDSEPQPSDFETQGEYVRALVKWERQQERHQDNQQTRLQRFSERIAQAAETDEEAPKAAHAVIKAAMRSQSLGAQAVVEALVDTENPVPLARHLYANPKEAARIAALSPFKAAMELGRLEAKLMSTPQNKKPTNAPPPITPVGGAGGSPRDIGDPNLSAEERIGLLRKQREA